MRSAVRALLSSRFLRFGVSGGVAAAANIGVRILLSQVMSFSAAIVLAYFVGMTVAFVLMKFLVFETSGRHPAGEYLRFGLVNVVALAQVWCVSMGLARVILPWLLPQLSPETPAHVVGVLSPIATSYFLHKHFTFGKTGVA